MIRQATRNLLSSSVMAGFLIWSGAAAAQETRLVEGSYVAPEASLEDANWLVGDWSGSVPEGHLALEQWLAPIGKLMVGTWIETGLDAKGEVSIVATEHMHLYEDFGTLKLVTMSIAPGSEPLVGSRRLIAVEPCALYFEEVTMRCADPDKPGEGLVVVFRVSWPDEPLKEDIVTYSRAD